MKFRVLLTSNHERLESQPVKYHTLVVIVGPTAVGKTGVAIRLAKALDTDVISADSRQIFREMSVGTAKPTEVELKEVRHHFIDSHSIQEDYDAAAYGKDALDTIHEVFKTHRHVILCGGSGLYVKAVCEGFDDIPEVPEEVRQSLVKGFEEQGIVWLQDKMRALDPELMGDIDINNPHRMIRALEVRLSTGRSISDFRKKVKRDHSFNIVRIGLGLPREILNDRIDRRMDQMIAEGLFEEAKKLYPYREKNALQTVGYQEIFGYIDGLYDYDETVRLLKRNSRRYAKRQMTWFKRDPETKWFHPEQITEMLTLINQYRQL